MKYRIVDATIKLMAKSKTHSIAAAYAMKFMEEIKNEENFKWHYTLALQLMRHLDFKSRILHLNSMIEFSKSCDHKAIMVHMRFDF